MISLDMFLVPLFTVAGTVVAVYFLNSKGSANKTKPPSHSQEPKKLSQGELNEIQTANNKARAILLEAKDEALKVKQTAERESVGLRQKAMEAEKKAQNRIDEFYSKLKEVEIREKRVNQLKGNLKRQAKEIEESRRKQIEKLQSISSLTKKEARELILENVEKTLKSDITKRIKEFEEQYQSGIDNKTKELLVDAMHHAATDYVAEYTISTVKLEDPDIKGRIIGKEGRNIRAFEEASGVNVDFENENEVRLSSFDSVRREIAKRAMTQLIKDGRIQPSRIEQVIKKTEAEVQKTVLEAGEELCRKVGVYNLPHDLVQKLGEFKYRTSFGQNMIQHTLEETKIGTKLASEIGADTTITKLACLLHDIGKVVTDKDGNHVELGAQYLRKFNLPKSVITAVSEHHDDKPSTTEGVIVQIADSISGARPGARYEDFEKFLERMTALEKSAMSFKGVDRAYAISAGREVRVIVKPSEVNDENAIKLSHDIAKKIQNEQTYPGTVKVIVVRETRNVATAT